MIRLPVILSLVMVFGLAGCSEPETRSSSSTPVMFPSSEATNATTVFLTESIVSTRIHSGRIVSWADNDSAWAWDIDVDFYNYAGKHTSKLRADSALVRERSRLLEGLGKVRIVTDDGRTLESSHLAWNDKDRLITTDSLVTITRGEDIMSGYGFVSDPELTHIRLRRQVRGRMSDTEALKDSL